MTILRVAPMTTSESATAVLFVHGELRLLATHAFAAGEPIAPLQGDLVETRTRYSIELDRDCHLSAPAEVPFEGLMAHYYWRFLNHSCRPNTMVRGRELVAAAPIVAFEELCFDYDTTEWELAEPFVCRCGVCDGREVRGFRHLSPSDRTRRRSLLAPHLQARFDDR